MFKAKLILGEGILEKTQNTQAKLYQSLRDYLLHAEACDVYHARPSQIAGSLNQPMRATLEGLVNAMFAGDAILHWELECPACKAFAEIKNPLALPIHETTCKACQTHFTVHSDEETQVTFSPHANLRPLEGQVEDKAYLHELHQKFPPTTVHELMTVQTFREWAQNEPLPSGEYLDVRKMVVWFSDLTGSTALYARNGDPFAFNLVREHFTLVTDAILAANGAVVKTIGDGVMAVFSYVNRGLQAALDANQRLEVFNNENQLSGDRRLQLKVGIHTGPAIVVTLNDRLDYFGTTVNIASRVSDLAKGQEIILTQMSQVEPEVADMMQPYRVDVFKSDIRGLEEKMMVYRLKLHTEPEPPRKGLLGFWDRLGNKTATR